MARLGVFIKTCSAAVVEVLALAGLDFGIVDAEHSPFDRSGLDLMILAGRAADLPLYVRVPDDRATTILQVLDLGAHGLVVPHVDTPEQAAAVVRRARFQDGERGYSNVARFGLYGATTVEEAIAIGDRAEVICQIETPTAVDNARAIAETPGVAGLLVGRADLALSMGLRSTEAHAVVEGARTALAAARDCGKLAAIVIGDTAEMTPWLAAGADVFAFGGELGLLRNAAAALVRRGREQAAGAPSGSGEV